MGLTSQTWVQCVPWGSSACRGLWCSSTGLVCAAGVWRTQCGCAAGPMRDPPRAPCAPGTPPPPPAPPMRSGAGGPGCAPRLPPPRICSQKGMSHGGRGAPHRAPRTAPRTAHLRGVPPMSGTAAPGRGAQRPAREGKERTVSGGGEGPGAVPGAMPGAMPRTPPRTPRPPPPPSPAPASMGAAGRPGAL